MPAIFEYPYRITAEDIDGQGHVNNVSYVRWMQDAAVAHSRAQGWNSPRYEEIGCSWVARRHTIEYLQPAFTGERIVVLTWIADMKKVTSLRKYRIIRPQDSCVLAVAETNWAFVNSKTGSPKRIPIEIIESFELVMPESEPE